MIAARVSHTFPRKEKQI